MLGVLIQFSGALVTARLAPQELPAWAVYGTAGSSFMAYVMILRIAVIVLTVLLALGVGYYIGRQLDITREYRRIIRTVAIGSTVGVGFVSLIVL